MIFLWWKTHRRDLPWRHTHDPYKIFVSEVMLQQTQVLRVLPKYVEFIEAFPTVQELAKASPAQVLRAWKGMGYNRRALYLRKAAQIIAQDYDGKFPKDEKLLAKLPGLGIYTARAVLVFAYKQDVSLVDTNIRQIITHFFFDDIPQPEKVIEDMAGQLLPKGKSWEWHQALMDFGALRLRSGQVKKLKVHKVVKSKPFKESSRFYRGRIIDWLREGDIRERVLITELTKRYAKPPEFIQSLINDLMKEGLVERNGVYIGLPRGRHTY